MRVTRRVALRGWVVGGAALWAGAALPAQSEPTPKAPAAPGRRLLLSDDGKRRIAIVAPDGTLEWEYKIAGLHDLHSLPGGTVLFQSGMQRLLEVDPRTDRVVWQYDASKMNGNAGQKVEVHAFQRLADGITLIAESGIGRLIEVDKGGKLVRQIRLRLDHPHPHRDTRLARKLDSGHYLVCHEGDGAVREYDPAGKVAWEYRVPLFDKKPRGGHGPEAWGNQVFSAVRLKDGNTLIGTGNGNSVLEVTPAGRIDWALHQNDLAGITLAWVTTLQVLPGGNLVIGNCHAGPANPQVVEVTREKKVAWSFTDHDRFGNSTTNSQVLDVESLR